MASVVLPRTLYTLFWDVNPDDICLPEHQDYVLERVMQRGSWEAMRWVLGTFEPNELASFLARKGERLAPRERAYWTLMAGISASIEAGGGRPVWAGK